MGFLTRIVGIVYTFVETGLPQFLVEFVLFNLKFSIQCFVNHSVTFRLRFFRLAIVFSCPLRFTVFEYPFSIFRIFLTESDEVMHKCVYY